jgi:5-formyltetrahydrofolate cyclo-ligase
MADPTLLDIKARLRGEALSRRDALDPAWRAAASNTIADRVLALPGIDGGPVSGFWSIRSEVDCRGLMAALHARGAELCLPVLSPPRMIFRRWAPGEPLESRGFGLSEPPSTAPAIAPRICLVPLAAFDRRGGRLGYGKGYYDGALAALAAQGGVTAIGLAFSVQEVEAVPREPHDHPLDLVITEREVVDPLSIPPASS